MRGTRINWLFIKALLFFLLFFCTWGIRLKSKNFKNVEVGDRVKIKGVITSNPYFTVSNQILKIGQFKVFSPLFPGYSYGDHLEISGKVDKVVLKNFDEEFLLFYPEIHKIEGKEKITTFGVRTQKLLFTIRQELEKIFKKTMPEPENSLLAGILLGIKRSLPGDFFEKLRLTGTLHVIVASGMNVMIVSKLLIDFLVNVISRKKALIVSLFGILIYTGLAGAEPPIVRAAIMGSLSFLAMYLGREADGLIALLLAGGVMLLGKPRLLFDLGFQLSFAATLGIILLGERLREIFKKLPRDVGNSLAETTAAQIAVAPILAANFGRISLVSLIVNGVLLWMIPAIMYLGLVLLILGIISIVLGKIFGLFLWPILHLFVVVVEVFSKVPWAEVKIEWFGFEAALIYYAVLFAYLSQSRIVKFSHNEA